MIRMVQSTSASQAKAYFTDALSKADYYLSDQELQGWMGGKLAERLNLTGPATREVFFALADNIDPKTGKPLTPRTKDNRRTGYDVNFHCPKSFSILAALSSDDHLLKAFEKCVDETMHDIEADAKTRVRKNNAQEDRATGNLIYASFTHQTARPVEDHTPDMHLHRHVFVFNCTFDPVEQKIKAGEFGEIARSMPYYQARFHKRLADTMVELGYQVRKTQHSFEVVGVPQVVIDHFSKRTDQIGRVAKELGITDAKEKAELGARTRAKKQKGLSMADLKVDWKRQIDQIVIEKDADNEAPVRFAPQQKQPGKTCSQCIDYALQHHFERASVMPERRLLETVYSHALGDRTISLDDITAEFQQDNRIIRIPHGSRNLCTTKEVLMEEKRMVELAREGLGAVSPLYSMPPLLDLDGQQGDAVRHVLMTTNRVSIIRGAAGTGKTRLMTEAVALMNRAGKTVTVVAPTANASRGVLRDDGHKNAETVAKLLSDRKMQNDLKDQVLWVDEAGLLGTQDMVKLLELAKRKNARLILGGDTRQHSAVVRGDALRILNTVGGIRSAEVSKIRRQKNEPYKNAVEELAKGNIAAGFGKLDAIGAIKTVDPLKAQDELVTDYVKALKSKKSALVISPTHKQGEELTAHIRQRLKKAGKIGKRQINVTRYTNLNLTQAEKSDAGNFRKGQILQFNQNLFRIKRGSNWTVTQVKNGKVQMKNEQGRTMRVPLNKAQHYDVLEKTSIDLAKGDKLRITRNGFDADKKRLNNGMTLDVVSVSKEGNIIVCNKSSKATYKIDRDYGHIAHAHVITSHASQGKTVDEVFIMQPSATFGASDAKQFYVSVSRGEHAVHIYTDDREALLEQVTQLGDRQSALELVGDSDVHLKHVMHRERSTYKVSPEPKERNKEFLFNKTGIDRGYEPEL